MKKCVLAMLLLAIGLGVAGCMVNKQQQPDGYAVLFEKMPKLYDQRVYYKGAQVGRINDLKAGGYGVVKVRVALEDGFAHEIGSSVVFYPKRGRLETIRLAASRDALSAGQLLCGFTSKTGLTWFKLKTLMKNRKRAADRLALALNDRYLAQPAMPLP